jgi:hypothetical protein
MNLNDNPTPDQLRDLLRPWDDRAAHHVLWVDRAGEVHVTPMERKERRPGSVPTEVLDNAAVRFETFWAGKGYVGPEAARDDEWVNEALDWLTRNWHAAANDGKPVLIRI